METLSTTEPHYIRCVKPNSLNRPQKFENVSILHQLRCGVSWFRICLLPYVKYFGSSEFSHLTDKIWFLISQGACFMLFNLVFLHMLLYSGMCGSKTALFHACFFVYFRCLIFFHCTSWFAYYSLILFGMILDYFLYHLPACFLFSWASCFNICLQFSPRGYLFSFNSFQFLHCWLVVQFAFIFFFDTIVSLAL